MEKHPNTSAAYRTETPQFLNLQWCRAWRYIPIPIAKGHYNPLPIRRNSRIVAICNTSTTHYFDPQTMHQGCCCISGRGLRLATVECGAELPTTDYKPQILPEHWLQAYMRRMDLGAQGRVNCFSSSSCTSSRSYNTRQQVRLCKQNIQNSSCAGPMSSQGALASLPKLSRLIASELLKGSITTKQIRNLCKHLPRHQKHNHGPRYSTS